jgi:hypothetical protein
MTMHEAEADRQADVDPVADDDEAPVEEAPETSWSLDQDAVDEDVDDEPDAVDEPELLDADESEQSEAFESADEPDPVQKLAPVGADTALDPGTGSFEDRWSAIQAGFIDDPRRTVESADALVTEVWDETVRALTQEREGVEARWQGTDSSTDDLRAVMQDYRALYVRYVSFTSD